MTQDQIRCYISTFRKIINHSTFSQCCPFLLKECQEEPSFVEKELLIKIRFSGYFVENIYLIFLNIFIIRSFSPLQRQLEE